MGHIYESVTLANDIAPQEPVVVFVEGGGKPLDVLVRNDIDTDTFDGVEELCTQLQNFQPSTVVFDHPNLDGEVLQTVRRRASDSRIVGIGNPETNLPGEAAADCDVIVNYSKDITSFTGVRREEDGCLFLEGTAYFIIRPEFVPFEDSWEPSASVTDVLLLFGASDPSNYSASVLERLLSSDREYDIDVILGPGYTQHDSFDRVRDAHDTRSVSVHYDVDDVCGFMRSTDVLLSSPGLTTFEALYIGCPVASICQTEAHTTAYHDIPFAFEYDEIEDIDTLVQNAHKRFTTDRYDHLEVGTRREEIVDAIVESNTATRS